MVVWGFLEVFTTGLYIVIGTLNQCGGDGVVTADQKEVGMGMCV